MKSKIPFLLAAIASLFSGTPSFAEDTLGASLDTVHLQLKWKHQFQFAGYYAALAQGYYRDAGLNVIIDEESDTKEPINEVVSGRAEFGIGTSELVVARSQGKPVVVLAAIFQHSPFIFLVNKNSGINNVHDLTGKKVAIEPQAAELIAYLRHEGLDLKKIDRKPHTYDTAPLISGEIDAMSAYSTDEPFILKQAGTEYFMFDPRAGGIDFYGDTLFTSEEQIRNHPDRVRAFREASLKGWKYALEHPQEMAELIYNQYSKRHGIDHLLFEAGASRRLILPDIVELGYINPGRRKFISDTYAELGLMPQDYPLGGFLYEPNPAPKSARFYAMIGGLVLLLFIVGGVGFWFYAMTQSLRLQMREREKIESHLRFAEERYRVLVENAPFPIAISSLKGKILFVNPRAIEIFKFNPKTVVGQDASNSYEKPESRAELLQQLEKRGVVDDMEVVMKKENGEVFWAYLSASKIIFEGQSALFTAFNDITARKKTEAERDLLIKELQDAAAEIETLTGILPICAGCKQIRDDQGFWNQVENYIQSHSRARFSHSLCPDCEGKFFPELEGSRGKTPPLA